MTSVLEALILADSPAGPATRSGLGARSGKRRLGVRAPCLCRTRSAARPWLLGGHDGSARPIRDKAEAGGRRCALRHHRSRRLLLAPARHCRRGSRRGRVVASARSTRARIGIPVVSANKSLLAAHGESLRQLARARGTALRYEASCVAGVPFLGPFERRPLASRVRGLTASSTAPRTRSSAASIRGATFDAALARRAASRAEPNRSVERRQRSRSAEKLDRVVAAVRAHLVIHPRRDSDVTASTSIEPRDLRARAYVGRHGLRPVAHAGVDGSEPPAFVGPAFLPDGHPLAALSGDVNGIVLDAAGRIAMLFPGPGRGAGRHRRDAPRRRLRRLPTERPVRETVRS